MATLSSLKKPPTTTLLDPQTQLKKLWEAPTLAKIEAFEAWLKTFPQTEVPIEHFTGKDVYVRKIVIPRGSVCVGALHKYDHVSILISGKMVIWTEEKGVHEVTGPAITVAKSGMKRAGIALEDTVWATAHGIQNIQNAINPEDQVVDYLTVTTHKEYLQFMRDNPLASPRVLEAAGDSVVRLHYESS